MKFNKEGWGTAQMLILSGGLFIALLVVVYFISQLYGSFNASTKNSYYANLETNLASAAKRYVIDNNINIYDSEVIYSSLLMEKGYLKELKDKNGRNCSGYVKVYKIDFINQYDPFVTCENYTSNNY